MEIQVKNGPEGLVLSLRGRMDALAVTDFDREMNNTINKKEPYIILDLSRLDYISSAGLRTLLSASKKLGDDKGTVVICGLQGPVKEVFDISGFISLSLLFLIPWRMLLRPQKEGNKLLSLKYRWGDARQKIDCTCLYLLLFLKTVPK